MAAAPAYVPMKRPASRLLHVACALLVAGCLAAGGAAAQAPAPNRALETEIAREFVTLELAGWRLPDPTQDCIDKLQLKYLFAGAFGASVLIDEPELVAPPGPFYRITQIDLDPNDRRRRIVRLEWLLKTARGAARPVRDSFTFALNEAGGDGGTANMVREPQHMVIRRECFGG
jgi:hypothetical protein